MGKFINVILYLLFAVVIYATANEISASNDADKVDHTYLAAQDEGTIRAVVTTTCPPYFPDAELAGAGMHVQQITMSRLQRISILEYLFSLKSLSQRLADRDAVLSQHWCRLYDTTTDYCCHPVSEYYVFALRRIIV